MLDIFALSSGIAETHPAKRIHLGGRGHLNAAKMTKKTKATNNPRGTTPQGRPIEDVTERLLRL